MTPERALVERLLVERLTALLATQDHRETCGFRLYGPPAICLCAAKLPLADALDVIAALTALRDENARLTLAASESARTLQVRIAELEAGERHCDEYHGELADQVTALREALMLPLMFHSGGVWTSEKAARWFAITGTTEATTKVMCDTIRKALAFPQDGA